MQGEDQRPKAQSELNLANVVSDYFKYINRKEVDRKHWTDTEGPRMHPEEGKTADGRAGKQAL